MNDIERYIVIFFHSLCPSKNTTSLGLYFQLLPLPGVVGMFVTFLF